MGMSDEQWREANNASGLRAGLQAKADRIAGRARSITQSAGGSAVISTEAAVRPGGRARVNVVSSDAAEEFGREGKKRTRALGRAARGG